MKKFLAILLSLTLILTGFTACGGNNEDTTADPETNAGEQVAENEAQAQDADADKDKEDKEKDKEDKDKKDKDKEKKDGAEDKEASDKPAKKPAENNKNNGNSGSKPSAKPAEKPAKAPKGTPSSIIAKIYGKKAVELNVGTMEVDLSDSAAVKAATGITSIDKVKAAAYSEAMIGSQAYSLVVVRAKDAKNAKSLANEMRSGIDPRKWICVEADDLRVAAYGDLIMLVMVDSALSDIVTSKEMVDAFKSVCGGNLDVSLS